MKSPIPVAVVGLGRAGWDIHIKQMTPRSEFKVVDVVDPELSRRQEAAEKLGCGTHATLADMLRKSKAELVVIATPSFMHEKDAIQALKSGRHCILEKPMAMSHAGAKRILAAAKKAKKKLFVHQNYRFNDDFTHLREVIDSGILGRIILIQHNVTHYARRIDWQTLRKKGGGILNNTGPHCVDSMLNLLDSPVVDVMSDLKHVKDAGDAEDHCLIMMKTKAGQVGQITLSTCCAQPLPRWMIWGSHGTLSTDGKQSVLKYYDPRKAPKLKVIDGAVEGRKYGTGEKLPWQEETRETKPARPFMKFYDNVADVLLNKGKMYISPDSAAEVMKVIEWARKGTKFPPLKV
jgi:scyllo-inositol 2-dehydrogenase (NADP+)